MLPCLQGYDILCWRVGIDPFAVAVTTGKTRKAAELAEDWFQGLSKG